MEAEKTRYASGNLNTAALYNVITPGELFTLDKCTQSLDAHLEVVYEGGPFLGVSAVFVENISGTFLARKYSPRKVGGVQPPLNFTRRGKSWPVLVRKFAYDYLSFSCRGV